MARRSMFSLMVLLVQGFAFGQGTFQFDQQSSIDETPPGYGSQVFSLQPTGQSFTPTLSGINFARLMFDDGDNGDGFGATIYLNLRSQSIAGPILGTTPTVNMPNGFHGTQNFFFPSTIALTPGTTYYFEVVAPSAFDWLVDVGQLNYAGGTAFAHGAVWAAADYWFREGLYTVPEPGPVLLAALGAIALVLFKRPRTRGANSS